MPQELTLGGLRVVQEVAAHGSFTAAADALGYTQSAISRQVAAMEHAAGAPLFERLPRGVRPTGAGTVLLRHAGPLLERADAAALELRGLGDRLEGRIALGAFPSAMGFLVPGALARVRARHPAIVITLREGSTPAQLRRLRAGRLELAVVALDPDAPEALDGLRADALIEGGMLVAVPAAHPLAKRERVELEDLAEEPWIVADPAWRDTQIGAWRSLEEPRIAYVVRDWVARLGLVAAGLGLAVIPDMAARQMPPGIAVVAVNDPLALRRVAYAVTREERSPGVSALVQALREESASGRERPQTAQQ